MHPKDRKKIKKQNLKDAKSHFEHKVVLEPAIERECLKEWFIRNRYRSWKEKGLAADYFTRDHRTFWFREKHVAVHFLMSLK